jgi:hypothetical protein
MLHEQIQEVVERVIGVSYGKDSAGWAAEFSVVGTVRGAAGNLRVQDVP